MMRINQMKKFMIMSLMFCKDIFLRIDDLFVFLFLAQALKKYPEDFKITSLIFLGFLLESQKINCGPLAAETFCVKSLMIFLEHLE